MGWFCFQWFWGMLASLISLFLRSLGLKCWFHSNTWRWTRKVLWQWNHVTAFWLWNQDQKHQAFRRNGETKTDQNHLNQHLLRCLDGFWICDQWVLPTASPSAGLTLPAPLSHSPRASLPSSSRRISWRARWSWRSWDGFNEVKSPGSNRFYNGFYMDFNWSCFEYGGFKF